MNHKKYSVKMARTKSKSSSMVLFIFVTLMCEGAQGVAKTYHATLKALLYREKIIFDRTKSTYTVSEDQPHSSAFKSAGKELPIILTRTIYYRQSQDLENYTLEKNATIPKLLENVAEIQPMYISLMVNKESILEQQLHGSIPFSPKLIHAIMQNSEQTSNENFTLIFHLKNSAYSLKSRSELNKRIQKIIPVLKSRLKNINIGLEFQEEVYKADDLLLLVNCVDVIILNVDIPLHKFVLSYSRFRKYLRNKLDDNANILKMAKSNSAIYAKINLQNQFNSSEELYQSYSFYLFQYAVYWVNDGEMEGLILKAFDNASAFIPGLDGGDLSKLLTFHVSKFESRKLGDFDTCQIKAVMEQLSVNFESVSLSRWALKNLDKKNTCILAGGPGCDKVGFGSEGCYHSRLNLSFPNIHFTYRRDLSNLDEMYATSFKTDFKKIKNTLKHLPWKLLEVDFLDDSLSNWDDVDVFLLNKELYKLPSHVLVACGVGLDYPYYLEDNEDIDIDIIVKKCSSIWRKANIVIWNIANTATDLNELTNYLFGLGVKFEKFLQKYPEKSLILRLCHTINDRFYKTTHNQLYCSENKLELYEMVEVTIAFARIRKLPIIIEDVITYRADNLGGWRVVETIDELNMSKTSYPLLVSRNFPDKFLLEELKTDPCISWTTEVPSSGIQLDSSYAGTTLYVTGRKNDSTLEKEILEVMLMLTFHKFSIVEIVPSTVFDTTNIFWALANPHSKMIEQLLSGQNSSVKIYLRIDCDIFNTTEYNWNGFAENVTKATLKPAGIHFYNWSFCKTSDLRRLRSLGILLGLSLEDCVNEVNSNFEHLKGLAQFNWMDYIACNIKYPQEASNVNKEETAKFLDTTLYIQKYFRRIFPNSNKEVIFRFNTFPTASGSKDMDTTGNLTSKTEFEGSVKRFLTFFSDVCKYSSAYKMKFFMFPAFDNMDGSQYGWWKILNFDKLTNYSSYVKKESEFLNRSTWRPDTNDFIVKNDGILINKILLTSLGILLAIILAFVVVVNFGCQRQLPLLTKEEVNDFLHGQFHCSEIEDQIFPGLPFPNELKIDRDRIVLLELIGKGNFGLVYKAIFSDRDDECATIAVKIPRPGSSKHVFKCMLCELKVLCHIGSHPNVIEFLGAYINEIKNGLAYIATELCENGSLQDHLRRNFGKTRSLEGQELPNVNELQTRFYDLSRFSREIALGMEYIESKKVVHGDLSARNVLLDSNFVCKVGDFGQSKKLYESQEYVKKKGEPLPWRWLAIESLKRLEFTSKSDVWSFGITMWEIFSLGSTPYPGLSWNDTFLENLESGFRMSAPTLASEPVYQEMRRCWNKDPMIRPSFTELAEFFAGIIDMEYTPMVSR